MESASPIAHHIGYYLHSVLFYGLVLYLKNKKVFLKYFEYCADNEKR